VDDRLFPEFFARAPVIVTRDPLAQFLGAAAHGILEYRYADAVRLAGHSCPTVASAFLMIRAGLRALYGDALPERGNVRVDFPVPRQAGVTGVIAAVAGLVTGATEDTGFRGIGGRFNRRELLFFGQTLHGGEIRFTRLDRGAAAEVSARTERVPGDPRMADLMPACLAGTASAEQGLLFRELWQDRVRRLLTDHADDPEVIGVRLEPRAE
jgi:hypothetical protein